MYTHLSWMRAFTKQTEHVKFKAAPAVEMLWASHQKKKKPMRSPVGCISRSTKKAYGGQASALM